MKKELFERFIKKYHLNGRIGGVRWITKNGTLQVTTMTSDRKLFADVTLKRFDGFEDAEIGIMDTKKLLRLLESLPPRNLSFGIVQDSSGCVDALMFSESKYAMRYATSSLDTIDPRPKMKNIPPWNAAIILDDEFTEWLFGASAAMGDNQTLLTVEMSQETATLEVALGHGDRCSFQPVTVADMDAVKFPLYFQAHHLKEVLRGNPEFKDPVLNVSDAGLASIAFSEDDLDSEYYLVKINVED